MKKLFVILLSLSLAQMSFAKDFHTKDINQLPKNAQEFIKKHFPKEKVSYIIVDKEFTGNEYEVKLQNGQEIKFNGKGEWREVESKQVPIPESIIPDAINKYLKANFSNMPIKQIDRKRWGYEVELFNDLDLKFDEKGKLLKIDD